MKRTDLIRKLEKTDVFWFGTARALACDVERYAP